MSYDRSVRFYRETVNSRLLVRKPLFWVYLAIGFIGRQANSLFFSFIS